MENEKRFWKFEKVVNEIEEETKTLNRLFINGSIAEESWFDDEITPKMFKDELEAVDGDIEVWINSPGGDCVAAAQIYNMLVDHNGDVNVFIDGIAASAASVIAMAGKKITMSPLAMMMIHNPLTMAFGNEEEMKKAIELLSEVKESIINAYEIKTGLSRAKISRLMDEETWMNAKKAVELGFADEILVTENKVTDEIESEMFSAKVVSYNLQNKLHEKFKINTPKKTGRSVKELRDKLGEIKKIVD